MLTCHIDNGKKQQNKPSDLDKGKQKFFYVGPNRKPFNKNVYQAPEKLVVDKSVAFNKEFWLNKNLQQFAFKFYDKTKLDEA